MSSSVTGDLVRGGKLLVHIAENGHSFEIDCDESTLVGSVQRVIESFSGITSTDQLLLCLDIRLEPQNSLSQYNLPSDDREVFLYNKLSLHSNSKLPAITEEIDTVEIADPPLPSSSHDPHPLDDAADPALKALPSYERQFRYHYQLGNAIYSRTQARFKHCERLLKEAEVQERAVEVGRANLVQYYKIVNQNYMDFMRRYSQQYRYHSDILVNFGRDMERLKSCKLHPALQTGSRKCLLDFVKEENLRKWVETCGSSHKQLDFKISQFKLMFDDVKRKVEALFLSEASLPVRNMESMIKEHMRQIDEQGSIMQSLSKDIGTVKKLVDNCLSSQFSSSLRPHDAVSALGPMYDGHDKNQLPNMIAYDNAIYELLVFCMDKKKEMNIFVHEYMQKIAYMSYVIKDTKLQFHAFKEAIRRQDDLFVNLKLVRGIGPAYRACLAEVVRRKASMKLYMGMAGQLAERLAAKREMEVRKREDFLRMHGTFIPRDILASMGLYDIPNQCDVNVTPSDMNLLNLDISEVEHYAPEYLVGLPSKIEKHRTSSTLSLTNDGSVFSEAEENVVDFRDKYDSEEPLDCSKLLEIAGTSQIEVENAKLKAELASAIALICSFGCDGEFESLDDDALGTILKKSAEKTAEALHRKDEYCKHLQSLLIEKQTQCESYVKRIQELQQRLSDQYLQGRRYSGTKDEALAVKVDNWKSKLSGDDEVHMPSLSTLEPMDEVSYVSNTPDGRVGHLPKLLGKSQEGMDENMLDSSAVLNPQLDSLMPEPPSEELKGHGKDKMCGLLNNVPCDSAIDLDSNSKISNDLLVLQMGFVEKTNQLSETETKLKDAMEQVALLTREVEVSHKLLDESQINCAHLENCLHEAREEAQTHLCAADRRASEYNALRASAVKMRGLFERLRTCVASSGVADLADSLCGLAQSLPNSPNCCDDDGITEFRICIQGLTDKVRILSHHQTELLESSSKAEAVDKQLLKELEEKKELVKTLYKKHQLEKQANKEKISFGRLEVHEIAAFVLNPAGNYEAINRCCFNYYLSAESVALFTDQLQPRPSYIIGQIVHIEQQTVKSPTQIWTEHNNNIGDQANPLTSVAGTDRLTCKSAAIWNPYGLPIGSNYFVVTIAMLPKIVRLSLPSS